MNKNIQILTLFLIVGILLRIPISDSEIGVDSYRNHKNVNIMNELGYAPWNIHALSIFGLIPLSYPSGEYYLVSILTTVTSWDTILVILLVSILIGLFFIGVSLPYMAAFFDYLFVQFGRNLIGLITLFR